MLLLKIGYLDLTPYMDIQGYNMEKQPVYESWTDGNYIDHRNVVRYRHKGKAQIGFSSEVDFAAFQNALTAALRSGSYHPVQAYCTQTGDTDSFDAYIDITSGAKWDWKNSRQWHALTLTITER